MILTAVSPGCRRSVKKDTEEKEHEEEKNGKEADIGDDYERFCESSVPARRLADVHFSRAVELFLLCLLPCDKQVSDAVRIDQKLCAAVRTESRQMIQIQFEILAAVLTLHLHHVHTLLQVLPRDV